MLAELKKIKRKIPESEQLKRAKMTTENKLGTLGILELYRKQKLLNPELEKRIIEKCEWVGKQGWLKIGSYPGDYSEGQPFLGNVVQFFSELKHNVKSSGCWILKEVSFEVLSEVFVSYHQKREFASNPNSIGVFLGLKKSLTSAGFPYEEPEDFLPVFKAINFIPEVGTKLSEKMENGFRRLGGVAKLDEKSVRFADLCYFFSLSALTDSLYRLTGYGAEKYSDDVLSVEAACRTETLSSEERKIITWLFRIKDNEGRYIGSFAEYISRLFPDRDRRNTSPVFEYCEYLFEPGEWCEHLYEICFQNELYTSPFSKALKEQGFSKR